MQKLIILSSILVCLFVSEGHTQGKKLTKNEPINQPIGDDSAITWGDFNQLNWKLNAAFMSMAVWLLVEMFKSYKQSKDTTSRDIEDIKKLLVELRADLSHRPTNDEVEEKIKQGILYANGLRHK